MSARTNLYEIAQIRRRQHIGEDRDADTPPDKPSDMSKTIDDLVATSKKFIRLLYLNEKTNKNARATIRRLKTAKKRLVKQNLKLKKAIIASGFSLPNSDSEDDDDTVTSSGINNPDDAETEVEDVP